MSAPRSSRAVVMVRPAALLARLLSCLSFALLLCGLPVSLGQRAFPSPPVSLFTPPRPKHALVELLEQSAPLPRPERDWRPPDLRAWLGKESLAAALGLPPIRRLQLPIYVNVYVVGLDGTGGGGVSLNSAMLLEWMEALENNMPQSILRPHTDGRAAGGPDGETETAHTASTRKRRRPGQEDADDANDADAALDGDADGVRVSYRYHLRLVNVSPKVSRVVERYLAMHHRPESSAPGATLMQVDGEVLSGALQGLVSHLRLDDAYSLFVLNPRTDWMVAGPAVPPGVTMRYGYRAGLSADELDTVAEPAEAPEQLNEFLLDWRKAAASSYTAQLAWDERDGPQPVPQFTPRVASEDAEDGSKRVPQLGVLDHLAASEAWADSVLSAPFAPGPQSLLTYLRQQSQHHAQVVRSATAPLAQADCLLDAWVSRGRLSFVDLSAGPHSWGPAVGGSGHKGASTFPSLRSFVSARAQEQLEYDEAGEDTYMDAAYQPEAVAAERLMLLDLIDDECVQAPQDTGIVLEPTEQCRILRDQLQALDEFEARYAVRQEGEGNSTSVPAAGPSVKVPALDSDAGLAYFHDDSPQTGGANSGHDASIEVDHFLAQLSSTLSAAMVHSITPAVSSTASTGGYAPQVHFNLYVLVNHQHYDPLGDQFVARFKFGVEQLRLPSQTFTYSVHKLTLDSDAVLSMAYARSLRSAVVPSLRSGQFQALQRTYIDSATMEAALRGVDVQAKAMQDPLFGQGNKASTAALGSRSRTVSVFLFSVDSAHPLLVDRHFQSRSRGDMVLAVQNRLHLFEGGVGCNGRRQEWNLRDPLRPILASVAQVLGGLLPLHVKHSRAHGRPMHDWQWSAGLSPLALTSSGGLEFSDLQRDTLHRNYVLTALRGSAGMVNAHLRQLQLQRPTHANRMLAGVDDEPVSEEELRALNATADDAARAGAGRVAPTGRFSARTLQLQMAYGSFVELLSGEITSAVEALDFDRACRSIDELQERAQRFTALVRDLLAWNARDVCSGAGALAEAQLAARSSGGGWAPRLPFHYYLAAASICCGIVLYRLLRRTKDKPKLN